MQGLNAGHRDNAEPRRRTAVVYLHGKDGSADEADHFRVLFPGCDVFGFDYIARTPWEAKTEFRSFFAPLCKTYAAVDLIANSIGAWLALCADLSALIRKAYFISPIVDMEKLIRGMMAAAQVTQDDLKASGVIHTAFGEDLSWEYLQYVRAHPVRWEVPTTILFGRRDVLTSYETIADFAKKHHAKLTVMENGEHWFHTEEQMRFLDNWIKSEG